MVNKQLLFILLSVSFIWLRSSFSKFISGNFAAALGETLNKTIDKNPYPLFKQFLISVVIPNSYLFGTLVMWGELLSGIAITAGVVLFLNQNTPSVGFGDEWFEKNLSRLRDTPLFAAGRGSLLKQYQVKWARLVLTLGLAGGIFLNINFWLGLGSANPASDNLNLLMISIEVTGLYFLVKKV